MADYIRREDASAEAPHHEHETPHKADAPSAQEIEQGYAPSTIRGTPFAKFLFWTFAGLGITGAIAYGTYVLLYEMQGQEHKERYGAQTSRQPAELIGPRLQPSKGHGNIDFEDMNILRNKERDNLRDQRLWREDPEKRSFGRPAVNDAAVVKAQAAIKSWSVAKPATQPAADVR